MPKYWGKQIFTHRSFPKVGEKQKAKKKRKREKKRWFSSDFFTFYGQCSVTAAWATRSPWSILFFFSHSSAFDPSGNLPCVKICFPHWFSSFFCYFYCQRSATAAWATRSPWSIVNCFLTFFFYFYNWSFWFEKIFRSTLLFICLW